MTIFDNIVKDENTFTELFKNLLGFKAFRLAFLDLLKIEFSKEEIESERFFTQKNTDNGRPDLILSTDEILIFFEVKVWNTNLTNNQPAGYLKALEKADQKVKCLVLLIPDHYVHLDEFNRSKEESNSKIETQVIRWNDVSRQMDKLELFDGNPILQEYRNLLKEWFEPEPIILNDKFMETMFTSKTPESLVTTANLVDQVKHEMQKRGEQITYMKKDLLDEYGFYINYSKEHQFNFFFGEWLRYWREEGKPICFCIYPENDDKANLFKQVVKSKGFPEPTIFKDTPWLASFLTFENSTVQVDVQDIANKLKSIIDELKRVPF